MNQNFLARFLLNLMSRPSVTNGIVSETELFQVSSVAILAQTNWTVSGVPSMSSNPQPLANSERTGQIVELLIIHHVAD